MEAVIAKSNAAGRPRKAALQRKGKGPGVAIMIAIGKPKPGMGDTDEKPSMGEELDASKGEGLSKSQKIAALEEKIGYLQAELALLKGGEDDEEMDDDEMDED
jgi:hypothetical protein